MKLGEIVTQYRAEHDLSQRQFAILCGLSNGTISNLEKGINPNTGKPLTPSLDLVQKLAYTMGLTLTELLTQADDMPIALVDDESESSSTSIPYGSNIIPLPSTKKTPLIGAIACGAPILAQEHIEDYVDTPTNIHADFALICKGDSMINARIFDGDVVYVRQQKTVENGEIAAVLIDNEATLKRVRIFEDHIVLEPENPHYRPLAFWGEEMNNIQILGKAVAFTSTVR